MKRLLFASFLSLSLAACQKDKQDPQPDLLPAETKDWYILRAPDNRAIEAVAGDIDGTLTITTRYKVYLTKDKGKTWLTGDYSRNLGLAGLLQKQDTLLAMGGTTNYGLIRADTYKIDAVSPCDYSLDQGLTWYKYIDRRTYPDLLRLPLNRLTNATGTEYLLTPTSPGSSSDYVYTIGVETSTGRHLTLPQEHQLNSIYFDAKSRLYIAGSAPVCGLGEEFKFCGDQKGTLYISKQPQL